MFLNHAIEKKIGNRFLIITYFSVFFALVIWLLIVDLAFFSRWISSSTYLSLSTRSELENIFTVDPLSNITQFIIWSFSAKNAWYISWLPDILFPFWFLNHFFIPLHAEIPVVALALSFVSFSFPFAYSLSFACFRVLIFFSCQFIHHLLFDLIFYMQLIE